MKLWVVFDGPPSHESGRFVEVEDQAARSVGVGEWRERPDGLWELGPFQEHEPFYARVLGAMIGSFGGFILMYWLGFICFHCP